ncbi:unnamed protein product, partial [Symbiodinium pilosum]
KRRRRFNTVSGVELEDCRSRTGTSNLSMGSSESLSLGNSNLGATESPQEQPAEEVL